MNEWSIRLQVLLDGIKSALYGSFCHFILMIVFPTIFSGNGLKLNFDFILKSVFLTGGIDLNWLVLLFIELALIFPIMEYISRKKSLATFYFLLSTFFVTATLFLPSLHSLYRVIYSIIGKM